MDNVWYVVSIIMSECQRHLGSVHTYSSFHVDWTSLFRKSTELIAYCVHRVCPPIFYQQVNNFSENHYDRKKIAGKYMEWEGRGRGLAEEEN